VANPDEVAIVLRGAKAIAEARGTSHEKVASFDLSGANLNGAVLTDSDRRGIILPQD